MNRSKSQLPLLLLLPLLTLSLSCRSDRLIQVPPCQPSPEVCDGEDNDCDGIVDNVKPLRCDNSCGAGQQMCVKGKWTECDAPLPKPETCNGKDDDCNGVIDDDSEIGVAPCYPGNMNDLLHGECRFGVSRCIGGAMLCQGAVTPKPELCNGKDDNCNGQVDEGFGGGGLDLVFGVDYSGSMTDKLYSLGQATSQWANANSGRVNLKMALLGVPSDDISQDGDVTLMHDLTDPTTFAAFLNLHLLANGGGSEPTIDAIYETAETSNPLGIHWTPGYNRALIIYTDELPQSYLTPEVTEQDAQTLANSNGLKVFVFSSEPLWYMWNPSPFLYGSALTAALDNIIKQGTCQ